MNVEPDATGLRRRAQAIRYGLPTTGSAAAIATSSTGSPSISNRLLRDDAPATRRTERFGRPNRFASTAAMAETPAKAMQTETKPDPRAIVVERSVKHDYQATLDAMRQQLKADGWKLIAEIDLGKRLEKKGVEIPGGLVIFKLTSGKNAVPLLAADETRYVSAMMPCGLSVYGKSDGSVVISRMNFEMMGAMMEPAVAAVMERSIAKLNRTVDAALAKLAGN